MVLYYTVINKIMLTCPFPSGSLRNGKALIMADAIASLTSDPGLKMKFVEIKDVAARITVKSTNFLSTLTELLIAEHIIYMLHKLLVCVQTHNPMCTLVEWGINSFQF